jgi:beta-lactamase superfamily II metal-dependent hydrolase
MIIARIWIYCIVLILVTALHAVGASAADKNDLEIIHIDVGQGDATLIISPSGKTMLVDGGQNGRGKKVVVPLLEKHGISHLDYVIATHYDSDHIGGLDEVLNFLKTPPGKILDTGSSGPLEPRPLKTAKGNDTRYADYVQSAGLEITREAAPTGRGVIDLGAGVIVSIVASNGCVPGGGEDQYRPRLDENGASIALVITHGTFDYFIGGDLTGGGPSGKKLTENMETPVADKVGHVDALRLSHHGSSTSSNKYFLKTLRPSVAFVSAGDGHPNTKYFHPTRGVLDRLHNISSRGLKAVYATNKGETRGGLTAADKALLSVAKDNIVLRSDGKHFSVNGDEYRTDGAISPAAAATVPLSETCNSHKRKPVHVDS